MTLPYLERLRLDGRRALVTGGASGIGLACVEALAEFGAEVTIADRDQAAIELACQAMTDKNYRVGGTLMDVTNSVQVTQVADGSGRFDILVNNAGIARSDTPAEKVTDEHWRNVIDVN